jgi:hypothetical protein
MIWRTAVCVRASRLGVRSTGSVNSSRVVASWPLSSDTLDKGRYFHNNIFHRKRDWVLNMAANKRTTLTFFLNQKFNAKKK